MQRIIASTAVKAIRSNGARRVMSTSTAASSSSSAFTKLVAGTALTGGLVAYTLSSQYAEAKSNAVDMGAVRAAILKVFHEDENLGPSFVRLAWHASGTYDKASKSGGSGGGATMRFEPECAHGANAGLPGIQKILEPIHKQFPELSYADLWTYTAIVVIEEMAGPKIPWRGGRVDATSGAQCTPNGRLPDADKGNVKDTIQHMRDIFYRMGFNDREIVALAGAHALGRCHTDRSGYDGPWTRAPTTFSNEYYKLLLNEHWTVRQWAGPQQWQNDAADLMMLPSDMAFIWDKEFLKYVRLYAEDEKAFFQDFSKAFQKLEELGVDFAKVQNLEKPWYKFW